MIREIPKKLPPVKRPNAKYIKIITQTRTILLNPTFFTNAFCLILSTFIPPPHLVHEKIEPLLLPGRTVFAFYRVPFRSPLSRHISHDTRSIPHLIVHIILSFSNIVNIHFGHITIKFMCFHLFFCTFLHTKRNGSP